MCDSHRGFQSSEEGGVAVAERPSRKRFGTPVNRSDLGHLDGEGVDELPAREEPVATTRQLAHDAAAAVVAPKTPVHAPQVSGHDEPDPSQRLLETEKKEAGAHPQTPTGRTKAETSAAAKALLAAPKPPEQPKAVAAPKTTTSPRKDPPKAPAAPVQKPQPAPAAPVRSPQSIPAAIFTPRPTQPVETPEARKIRQVTDKLSRIREREKHCSLTFAALHQALNEFVNLLGTPFVNPNASKPERMRLETRAKAALADALRKLEIDEGLWPNFLRGL